MIKVLPLNYYKEAFGGEGQGQNLRHMIRGQIDQLRSQLNAAKQKRQ